MSAHKTFGQIFIAIPLHNGLQNVPLSSLSNLILTRSNCASNIRPFMTSAAKQEKKPTIKEKDPEPPKAISLKPNC